MITPDFHRQYQEEGFFVVPNAVDEATLRGLRNATDELVAGAHGLGEHTEVYDLEASHRPDAPRVRRIKRPHNLRPAYRAMAAYPPLVAILTVLLGPNVRLQSSILNMKSAGYGAAIEWHQDWPFYPHTNDDLLVAGIFLDDVDEANGPVQFLPGTHKGPVYDHHRDGRFVGGIPASVIGHLLTTARVATGPAGTMSFHHCRVVHGSALNRTDRPRRILYYEMNAADAWPLMGLSMHYGADPDVAFQIYNERIIAGNPVRVPRMEKVPVEIPLPPPLHRGSIYEAQSSIAHPFFDRALKK